ncbi:MAG: F0F1 ATP synthase subunit epsilon [Candidatus Acidiferrales bacterium]
MLPENIELEVVTPERFVMHETVQSLEMPGKDGYLGILPGHAPLLTELGIGILTYRKGAEARQLTVIQGFAEVLPDRVIVLAELSERAEEIDVERVRAALGRAQAELAKPSGSPDFDWERASFNLQRALIRLQVAGKGGASAGAQDTHHTSS